MSAEAAQAIEGDEAFTAQEEVELTPEQQKEKRKQEWGLQFDLWLIRAARNAKVVELLLSQPYPGVTTEGNIVSCVPERVDKYFIQVKAGETEVWINKEYIIGVKPLATQSKQRSVVEFPEQESENKEVEEPPASD